MEDICKIISLKASLNPSQDPIPSWIGEMEKFLMDDENNGTLVEPDPQFLDEFMADILLDSPASHSSDKIEVSNSSKAAEEGKEGIHGSDVKTNKDYADDHISKKRIRQLRNRDAALRSRERRKTHVKELEMKSRFLEGECRRLSWVLQYCATENQALRLELQSVSMTKQESAVLLLESLLLGSLLWLLGIICLPPLVSPQGPALKEKEGGLEFLTRWGRSNVNMLRLWEALGMGRRCGVSRSKMKCNMLMMIISA